MTLTFFLRALQRHPLASALNIITLALGIAVFLLLTIYARFENSYEKWIPDNDKIWVVQEQFTFADKAPDPRVKTQSAS